MIIYIYIYAFFSFTWGITALVNCLSSFVEVLARTNSPQCFTCWEVVTLVRAMQKVIKILEIFSLFLSLTKRKRKKSYFSILWCWRKKEVGYGIWRMDNIFMESKPMESKDAQHIWKPMAIYFITLNCQLDLDIKN